MQGVRARKVVSVMAAAARTREVASPIKVLLLARRTPRASLSLSYILQAAAAAAAVEEQMKSR